MQYVGCAWPVAAVTQFLVADTQLYMRLCPSVCHLSPQVEKWENKRFRTVLVVGSCIYAPAHLSATVGRVSGLVFLHHETGGYGMVLNRVFDLIYIMLSFAKYLVAPCSGGPSVRQSILHIPELKGFLRYCPCPTIPEWGGLYPSSLVIRYSFILSWKKMIKTSFW